MTLLDFLDGILRRRSEAPASFTPEPARILDEQEEGEEQFLQPQASYVEIRLKQMHLRDQREYWREFRPLTSAVTTLLHAGTVREIPFLVGPELLGKAVKLQDGDRVEYLNIRVAGPLPYEGDDLGLFIGLARMKVGDWAERSLSLLENFAKAFDASKLSSYLDIAGPLVSGLESFLGMRDVELPLGLRRDYQQPRGRGGLRPNTLQHRYEILLNIPDHRLNQAEREKFWVKEGRLFYGNQANSLQPYREADFLLYEIQPLSERADYTTFDFDKVYWRDTVKAIWEGNEQGARQKLRLLAANLVQCPDIVRPQRNILMKMYKQQFEAEMAQYNDMFSGTMETITRGSERYQAVVKSRTQAITEEDMVQAIRQGSRDETLRHLREQSPEETLSELGL